MLLSRAPAVLLTSLIVVLAVTFLLVGGPLHPPAVESLSHEAAAGDVIDRDGLNGEALARHHGDDRVATAVAVSQATFSAATDRAVVANAERYPDALTGSALAGVGGGPVLLTGGDHLESAVRDELSRLDVDEVVVLGGREVVSSAVADELEETGAEVVRIHGATRFETAAQVARRIGGGGGHAYLVAGQHPDPGRGWADAVAASGLSSHAGAPVLLTGRDGLPGTTEDVIGELGIERVTIVGGESAVSASVQDALSERGVSVDRLAGSTRYATSVRVAERSAEVGLDTTRPWIVTGNGWADALAAGPAATQAGEALLLVDGLDLDRSPSPQRWLLDDPDVVGATVVGGVHAVSAATERDLAALIDVASSDGYEIAAAGDIACQPDDRRWGARDACRHGDTAELAATADAALALGDLQYNRATTANFRESYDPTWGRFKDRTYPTVGNHEYAVADARDYFAYFGGRAGEPGRGYYDVELGDWHVFSLDSNCREHDGCKHGSAQQQWLADELAASQASCQLAIMHHPPHSSGGSHGSHPAVAPLYTTLMDGGADLLVASHAHSYERMRRGDARGGADPENGLRSFVVGTGGRDLRSFGPRHPLTATRTDQHFGVLGLELHERGYTWDFRHLDDSGTGAGTFTDVGFGSCA